MYRDVLWCEAVLERRVPRRRRATSLRTGVKIHLVCYCSTYCLAAQLIIVALAPTATRVGQGSAGNPADNIYGRYCIDGLIFRHASGDPGVHHTLGMRSTASRPARAQTAPSFPTSSSASSGSSERGRRTPSLSACGRYVMRLDPRAGVRIVRRP